MHDAETFEAVAGRIIEASSADETEVTIDGTVDNFVRFSERGPTQSADRDRVRVAIRVRFDAGADGIREAKATCGTLEPDDTARALERALALARLSPAGAGLLPLDGAVEVRATSMDPATAGHGFAEKARWVQAALAACSEKGVRPAGLIQTTGLCRHLANSAGRRVSGESSRAAYALTASVPGGGEGWGESIANRVDAVDPERVVARAVGKADRNRQPRAVDPGQYTVVLEPAAVSSMLLFASYYGFGAREVDEQASFLCGRMGERVFAPGLTVLDDTHNDLYPGLPFDGEGNPKQTVVLIEQGKLTGPVTDRSYARKLGLPCTGHAVPQPSGSGPVASNLVVRAGASSVDEMVGGVERGLLVTQFHYTNMIEPRELTLTGMTRNGTFLIENGEVVGSVKNLRFTDTLINALSRVDAIGAEPEVVGALFDGEVVTPAVRVDGFRFTSATDF